jgi:molybdate transport system ATP-binding protein
MHRQEPEGSPRNVTRGRVESVEQLGERVRVRVSGPVPLIAEVTPAAMLELGVDEGTEVWMAIKATDITVFPA